MNIWFFIFALGLAFLAQFGLTFLQIKQFSTHYVALRKKGKVAIGKAKGCIQSGAIVLFLLGEEGEILEGTYLFGVTVFAKWKPLPELKGKQIATLTDLQIQSLPKQVKKAVLNACSNYCTIIMGGEIPEEKSPFAKVQSMAEQITKKHSVNER